MDAIIWNEGDRNGSSQRLDWLDEQNTDDAIKKLEAAAGVKSDWDYDEETGWNWWGLVGTFRGVMFTVYTHKSGRVKIGGGDGLDVPALKAALLEVVK